MEAECIKESERVEAECEKEAERVEAECKTEKEHKKVYLELYKENPLDKKQRKMDRELYLAISKKDTVSENEGKSKMLVSFLESVEYNTEKVPEDNLDDTLELSETSEDSEQKVSFKPPSFQQIEKHVAQTTDGIRSIGTCTETDGGEKDDSDSLVIDDQIDSTPPCSEMPHNYCKTR